MNYGRFTKTTYIKFVVFSKAVLWYKRQISLRQSIIERIQARGLKKIIFVDKLKGEKWVFRVEKVLEKMELSRVGQEPQYYFPIDLAKRVKIEKIEPKKYVLDERRNVFVPVMEPQQISLFS